MSKLAALDHLLALYEQFEYHKNPQVFQRLQDVQIWQKNRMQKTHAQHFAEKNNQLMAQYFLNRLYGGADFDALAQQIMRLMKYAHKAEKIIPANAITTGTSAISLAILAVQLDEKVALQLITDFPAHPPLTDEMMHQTYRKLDQKTDRLKQLDLLDQLGINLDKYLRSFVLHTAFKVCKPVAYKHHFHMMYDFMQDGFTAMKPLKSAEKFVKDFTLVERNIVNKVHAGYPNPFDS